MTTTHETKILYTPNKKKKRRCTHMNKQWKVHKYNGKIKNERQTQGRIALQLFPSTKHEFIYIDNPIQSNATHLHFVFHSFRLLLFSIYISLKEMQFLDIFDVIFCWLFFFYLFSSLSQCKTPDFKNFSIFKLGHIRGYCSGTVTDQNT